MIVQCGVSFLATVSFAALFNVPRKQYFFCGLTGATGWICYLIICSRGFSVVFASFIATIILTTLSRFFAVYRKTPITLFLVSGIFPLVPGAGIYYTVYHLIMNENRLALYKGIETAKIAIAISLGIVLVFSLPYSIFRKIASHK